MSEAVKVVPQQPAPVTDADRSQFKRIFALAMAALFSEPSWKRAQRDPRPVEKPEVCVDGAFGGPDRRKRLVNGQVLDQSKACAKAGRRGGKANPKFGTRVGERG